MARPKSEDKRMALLDAAVRVFVGQGLSAPTALIAKEAGVANGTLFTYFETKAELLRQLYLELKWELAAASLAGHSGEGELKEQLLRLWSNWMFWAASNPEKLRVLNMLGVAEEVTPAIRGEANQTFERINGVLEQVRAQGPLREVPMAFVVEIMTSLGNATTGFMISDPENAEAHCQTGFEAMWRVVG